MGAHRLQSYAKPLVCWRMMFLVLIPELGDLLLDCLHSLFFPALLFPTPLHCYVLWHVMSGFCQGSDNHLISTRYRVLNKLVSPLEAVSSPGPVRLLLLLGQVLSATMRWTCTWGDWPASVRLQSKYQGISFTWHHFSFTATVHTHTQH